MKVEKAKWLNNADSPFILMIDDLANVWIDINNNGKIDLGEDWGFAKDGNNSSYKYLKENILGDFTNVRTTFFVPLDRKPILENHKYQSHFGSVNESDEIKQFFYNIHNNTHDEAAYHGITHGISGNQDHGFIQEWLMYKNLDEAMKTISSGKQLFKDVFGEFPAGGKYCGYSTNNFSDNSIDKSGFFWWCRFWNRNIKSTPDSERFELKHFGSNNVIDVPSTIAGNLFNFYKSSSTKRLVKRLLGREIITEEKINLEGYSQLSSLIKNKQVISVQEHISPARTDGKRQTLNIFDDERSLKKIFNFLKDKNIWYATCTEVAEYYELYNNTEISINDSHKFSLNYSGKKVKNNFLSILIECGSCRFELECPNGEIISPIKKYRNTDKWIVPKVPIKNGEYKLVKKS